MQLFGNFKGCFSDRIAAEMLIGLTTNRWKWNEWGKHLNICWNILIHVVMSCDIFVTIRDHSIYEREYWSDGNLIGKQRLNKTPFFPYLIVLAISVTLVKQRGRTFALKIRFEQNDSIPPSYQFKREDTRLNLHCEFVDWIEAFQLKKASLIAANLWSRFYF